MYARAVRSVAQPAVADAGPNRPQRLPHQPGGRYNDGFTPPAGTSFNGRTADSDSAYWGSNPYVPATHRQTSQVVLLLRLGRFDSIAPVTGRRRPEREIGQQPERLQHLAPICQVRIPGSCSTRSIDARCSEFSVLQRGAKAVSPWLSYRSGVATTAGSGGGPLRSFCSPPRDAAMAEA